MVLTWLAALAVAYTGVAAGADHPVASVSRNGSRWTVNYTLQVDANGWVFPVSAPTLAAQKSWRDGNWNVLTKGVRIERRGAYDALVSVSGHKVPRHVRMSFTPTNATLDREYDPALGFTNGSVALYSDQFDLVPVEDVSTIATREAGLSIADFGGSAAAVRFHDSAGPVFVSGKRLIDPVLRGAATYVVFGAATVQDVGGVAMLADPALPAWLKTDLATFVPSFASAYAAQLGRREDEGLPLLLVGWRGPTPRKVVNDGGVRRGEIILNFEGEGLLDRNEKAAQRTRWFVAHELAHFWLGSEGIAYRKPEDAWITEGGAELMTFTLLAKSDPAYVMEELQRAVADCIHHAAKPLATAGERHESRAFYACGTVFALAATSIAKKNGAKDAFDFFRPLIAEHRTDRLIGSDDWLAHVSDMPGAGESANLMRGMIKSGSQSPPASVEELLKAAGVPHARAGDRILLKPNVI